MKRQLLPDRCSSSRPPASGRQGAVLVAVLVCLLVVMAILGSMLKGTLRAHRQLRRERDLRQTEVLLQSGSQRTLARLEKDADYAGETWNLAADVFEGKGAGQVVINILPAKDQAPRQALITAEYPLGGETSIRRSRMLQIPPPRPNEQE